MVLGQNKLQWNNFKFKWMYVQYNYNTKMFVDRYFFALIFLFFVQFPVLPKIISRKWAIGHALYFWQHRNDFVFPQMEHGRLKISQINVIAHRNSKPESGNFTAYEKFMHQQYILAICTLQGIPVALLAFTVTITCAYISKHTAL